MSLDEVYDELRRLAAAYLRRERVGHTLQPTALVNEAWLKVAAALDKDGERAHALRFRGLAASAMRQILVDHARGRKARKRGGSRLRVTLGDGMLVGADSPIDLLALDEALTELAALNERKARVVEMRFFGGLTNAEAAEMLDIAPKTAEADWYMARAWLRRALSEAGR